MENTPLQSLHLVLYKLTKEYQKIRFKIYCNKRGSRGYQIFLPHSPRTDQIGGGGFQGGGGVHIAWSLASCSLYSFTTCSGMTETPSSTSTIAIVRRSYRRWWMLSLSVYEHRNKRNKSYQRQHFHSLRTLLCYWKRAKGFKAVFKVF